MNAFVDHLPGELRGQLNAVIAEGQLLARTCLQASLDAADTAAHLIAAVVVMRRTFWLELFRFPKEVQNMVEHLPFGGSKLVVDSMDKSLQMLEDSRDILLSLGIYTPKKAQLVPDGSEIPSCSIPYLPEAM